MLVVQGHRCIVPLLSWMETTFDVQMVFPSYQKDVSLAIERGLFRLQRGRRDRVELACGQLLDAISYVHSKSIVHRDIKPSNMFLAAVGADTNQDFTVALGDFGASTQRSFGSTQPPKRSSPPTTMHYLAPELFLTGAVCDFSSYIWALGVSIVQMDLSHVPFGPLHALGRTELSLIFLEAVRSVTTWVPGYRVDVAEIVKRKAEGAKLLQTLTMKHPRSLLWGRERCPEFQELTCGFLHIDRWHRPTAEELVARGKALGVLS